MDNQSRAELSAAQINDLPDSAFAYIESGGKKDSVGKTTPRKLRHYPVHDKAHADNALDRANAQVKEGDDDAKGIAEKALPKIKAAVKKFSDEQEQKSATWNAQHRSEETYSDRMELLEAAVSDKFGSDDDDGYRPWVTDFTDAWCVYCLKGEKFQVPYTMDGTVVKLGKATQVHSIVTYEPIESKSAPTPEDYSIAAGLKDTKMMLAGVKAKQLADPDYKTDPDDTDVMAAIVKAESAIDKAIVAQSKDGHEDEPRSMDWATPKRKLFADDAIERPVARRVEASLRSVDDESNIARFVGYPSTTGVSYAVRDWLGEYTETIMPGAFGKTLRERKEIPLLVNHNLDSIPLASTAERDGKATMDLAEADRGLRSEADLDRRDALTNSTCVQLERGVLGKMSFSFNSIKEAWNDAYDDRSVSELALHEVSIVTWPANPTTSAELIDGMRTALGREGRSLWLADQELSIRSALVPGGPVILDGDNPELTDLLEGAVRALAHADEVLCRTVGPYGRARTFLVAGAMLDLRAGKTLSSKNEGLLKQALDALGAADKHHQQMANNHAEATEKVATVLANSNGDGQSNQSSPGGNTISPQDGGGPRSLPPSVAQARRQVERLKRR